MKDVAQELQASRATIARLVATGELPSIKVGRLRRVRRRDLEQWMGTDAHDAA